MYKCIYASSWYHIELGWICGSISKCDICSSSLIFQPFSIVHVYLTPTPRHVGMVQLPPPPNATPIAPPVVNSTNYGVVIRQLGSRGDPNVSADDNSALRNDSGAIFMVNGSHINGYVYDANSNCIC